MIAFPEFFLLATQKVGDELALAQTLKGVWVQTLQEWAAEEDVWIVAGTLPMKTSTPGKTENTTLVIRPTGEIATRYRKIHLFGKEAKGTKPGNRAVTLKTPDGGTWGMSVCYDLRFPELYRELSQQGAGSVLRAERVHRRNGQGALGRPDPRARDRKPGLRRGPGPVGRGRRRKTARSYPDRGPLGEDPGRTARRRRNLLGGPRFKGP